MLRRNSNATGQALIIIGLIYVFGLLALAAIFQLLDRPESAFLTTKGTKRTKMIAHASPHLTTVQKTCARSAWKVLPMDERDGCHSWYTRPVIRSRAHRNGGYHERHPSALACHKTRTLANAARPPQQSPRKGQHHARGTDLWDRRCPAHPVAQAGQQGAGPGGQANQSRQTLHPLGRE